jgi:hypothetical protein
MIVDIDLPLAVPQGDADAWTTPAQGRSRFGFCNDPLCLPDTKGSRMQVSSLPTWRGTPIGPVSLSMPPIQRLQRPM